MILLRAVLHDTPDRGRIGTFAVRDAFGRAIYGPMPARGEADQAAAAAHGNPSESAARPFGDHPFGQYRVTGVTLFWPPDPSYGTAFIAIDPVGGEALEREEAGGRGLGIHDGPTLPDGTLRATFGCLRLPEGKAAVVAGIVTAALHRQEPIGYDAAEGEETA